MTRVRVCIIDNHGLGPLGTNRVRKSLMVIVRQEERPAFVDQGAQQTGLAGPWRADEERIAGEFAKTRKLGVPPDYDITDDRTARKGDGSKRGRPPGNAQKLLRPFGISIERVCKPRLVEDLLQMKSETGSKIREFDASLGT